MLEGIRMKIIDKVKDFFRNIRQGIPNLIKWTPVIWSDRNWDQHFLYVILQFKLKQMEKLHLEYGHTINAEKYAGEMRVCILLLERIIKDDYLMSCLKPHEKKWGELKMNFKPLQDDPELVSPVFTVEKAITKEEIIQENKERMRIYKHVDDLKKQDLDMLFKNIRKYVEGWWD
jgi:hypothetical protein